MKKVLASLVIIVYIIISMNTVAFSFDKNSNSHYVYGRYVPGTKKDVVISEIYNNKYDVETPYGFVVSVTPSGDFLGQIMAVREISSENEAYTWFSECFSDMEGKIFPLEIFYLDSNDNKINILDKITITLPKDSNFYQVYSLSTSGTITMIKAEITEDSLSWMPQNNEYYVLLAQEYIIGDVNRDEKVNSADARLALRISAKLEVGTPIQIFAADVDKNMKVTASDARKILRVSAKIDKF